MMDASLDRMEGDSRVAGRGRGDLRWEWLAELLEDAGYEVHLAHPLRTRAIAVARVKTDAVDARTLAHLLRADLLPEAYVAPRELRDLRELLRHRVALTGMRSALKNRVHAILAKHGITRLHADLFGKGGRLFLAELQLREAPRRRLDSLMIERFPTPATSAPEPASPRPFAAPTAKHGSDASHAKDRRRCAGHSSKRPRNAQPAAAGSAKATSGSRNAAARRSPRSPSPDRSSPSATTAYARRDPLPSALQPDAREREAGGSMTAAHATTRSACASRPRREANAQRARCLSWPR